MRSRFAWLMLAGAIVAFGGADALACSGPGAARTIRESELIGTSFAGVSIAILAVGCWILRRQSPDRRIRWIVAPLALHPRWWMDAVHGDCGFGLRFWSLVGTLWIAAAVALAVCWPRPTGAEPKKRRWVLCSALVGTLIGLPIVAVMLGNPGSMSATDLPAVVSVLCIPLIAGALIGGGVCRWRTRPGRGFRFSLRTFLLLPVVLAPLFVVLLPVLPYEASVSSTVRWVIVDEATGRPIPGAAVRLIDPTFALDDVEHQYNSVVAGADGGADDLLWADIHGREGLLGRTETITYNPLLIRVESPGYRPFFTSLAGDPPIPVDRLTARPLGLTFPAPSSVTIRLRASSGSGRKWLLPGLSPEGEGRGRGE
jgi:hypothetical protein